MHKRKSFSSHFKFKNYEVFRFCVSSDLVWFRFFGYGLHLSSVKTPESPFTEMIGKVKFWVVGGIRIKTIPFIHKAIAAQNQPQPNEG